MTEIDTVVLYCLIFLAIDLWIVLATGIGRLEDSDGKDPFAGSVAILLLSPFILVPQLFLTSAGLSVVDVPAIVIGVVSALTFGAGWLYASMTRKSMERMERESLEVRRMMEKDGE